MTKSSQNRLFRRVGHAIIMDRINPRAHDGVCELCGTKGELRPYGPNNENICFDCGMKDEAVTEAKFKEMMDGAD